MEMWLKQGDGRDEVKRDEFYVCTMYAVTSRALTEIVASTSNTQTRATLPFYIIELVSTSRTTMRTHGNLDKDQELNDAAWEATRGAVVGAAKVSISNYSRIVRCLPLIRTTVGCILYHRRRNSVPV